MSTAKAQSDTLESYLEKERKRRFRALVNMVLLTLGIIVLSAAGLVGLWRYNPGIFSHVVSGVLAVLTIVGFGWLSVYLLDKDRLVLCVGSFLVGLGLLSTLISMQWGTPGIRIFVAVLGMIALVGAVVAATVFVSEADRTGLWGILLFGILAAAAAWYLFDWWGTLTVAVIIIVTMSGVFLLKQRALRWEVAVLLLVFGVLIFPTYRLIQALSTSRSSAPEQIVTVALTDGGLLSFMLICFNVLLGFGTLAGATYFLRATVHNIRNIGRAPNIRIEDVKANLRIPKLANIEFALRAAADEHQLSNSVTEEISKRVRLALEGTEARPTMIADQLRSLLTMEIGMPHYKADRFISDVIRQLNSGDDVPMYGQNGKLIIPND
jgi:hypothetical protein